MGNYLKELLRKGTSTSIMKEYDIQEYGKLRIDVDKKSSILSLSSTDSILLATDISTEELKRSIMTIKDFISDTSRSNSTLSLEHISGEELDIKVIRYGIDITQIIFRFGNIGGFQIIHDNSSLYNEINKLKNEIKF